MTRKRHKRNEIATPDPRTAQQSGDAFRHLAQQFVDRIRRDGIGAKGLAPEDIGNMIASATTLALSVELYLKALQLLEGLVPPTDHDLWALFKRLPNDLKKSIERQYEILNSSMGAGIDMIAVQISVGPFREEEIARADAADDRGRVISEGKSLESVLKRNKSAFLAWRYLYEKGNSGRIITFVYEFSDLGCAAESIRQHILIGMGGTRMGVQPEGS